MLRWWIGESSDSSLLKLRRRRLASVWGYGEPQLAVPNSPASGGGVRSNSATRPGRTGAGSGGSAGDDSMSSSPSAVDAVDRAGDTCG